MASFEYRTERVNGRGWSKKLERLSEDGWTLVSVDDGLAYLKRPKTDSSAASGGEWRGTPGNDPRNG